ncbi:3-oxoacyl-(acyl-carrier-protein) synthase [Abditibacterium utsteinense]|uniref:3-oxoacyl-(Acyl-carrier-protein) synthase n=1 Tax=Abditibacterium utsteinense TaxID=1960156 RepID=A0A2S8SS75_9BACT|nr:beta-ketoacyl-[acyl-carrier-protein] synthase family protein [Abditibacterium utsteinense]PQV63650.1 3-oxoacyl-(acyl-carrier-protein) synthase [Abditibacterium utsteinense]
MRVAITDFFASYVIASQNRGSALHPHSSLQFPDFSTSLFGDPLFCARRILNNVPYDSARLGLVCGSSKGDLNALPLWVDEQRVEWTPDVFVHHLAESLKSSGPSLSPNAACATGAHSLALGAGWIQDGRTDFVFAGAVEFPQPEIILAAYKNMNALSKSGIMRPFDARRDGFVPSSGFGFLLLESEERARKRGAEIHGFLSGTSLKCDATHMTSMHASGEFIARAIEDALQKAGNPKIDYINAHGTATQNDLVEARAIERVFGNRVPVSSTKPLTGHLLGASGAVEAVICLLAMRENFAPPTLNLEDVDTELNLDFVPQIGRKMEINATLSLNYGFGGHIGALVFERN